MALRQLHSKVFSSGLYGQGVRAFSAPSVFDSIVHFTIIDTSGKRYTVKGLEGDTLASALEDSPIFGSRDIFTYGPGLQKQDTHIYVSQDYVPQLGTVSPAEELSLTECADERRNKYALVSGLCGCHQSSGLLAPPLHPL